MPRGLKNEFNKIIFVLPKHEVYENIKNIKNGQATCIGSTDMDRPE
jgi:hypothetical protein